MMENFFLFNDLLDIYGSTLTEKQQEIFYLYYHENLSMQEIADEKQVSKAFVGKVIKDSEKKLQECEEMFHLYNLKKRLLLLSEENDLQKIKNQLVQYSDDI